MTEAAPRWASGSDGPPPPQGCFGPPAALGPGPAEPILGEASLGSSYPRREEPREECAPALPPTERLLHFPPDGCERVDRSTCTSATCTTSGPLESRLPEGILGTCHGKKTCRHSHWDLGGKAAPTVCVPGTNTVVQVGIRACVGAPNTPHATVHACARARALRCTLRRSRSATPPDSSGFLADDKFISWTRWNLGTAG